MKTNRFFGIALLTGTMAVAASCNEAPEKTTENDNSVEVKFTSGIAALQSRVSGANGTNWDANDPVGIYMIGASDGLTAGNILNGADNRKYMASAGATASFTPAGSTIYYPTDGGNVKFIAYHPYSASVGGDFNLPISVATQTNQSAIDVLYAPAGTSYNKSSATASLPFAHKLVKLVFNISAGEGVTDTDLIGLVLKISGQQTTGTLDLATGNVSAAAGTPTEITVLTATDGKSSEAIVLPGSTTGVSFSFIASGITYSAAPPAGHTSWIGGSKYTYNVTLKKEASVIDGSISPWEDENGTITSMPEV